MSSRSPLGPASVWPARVVTSLTFLVILGTGLLVGLRGVRDSGPLWPDSPRYANAGAMIHDWLGSGELFHPYAFSKKNYAQYPAFNIPFHPPAFPGLLGVGFRWTGVSYVSARVVVALTAGLCGWFLFLTCRALGARPGPSLAAALLFLTMPEVAHWSRDTMSEMPSLLFAFVASWVFLKWLGSGKWWLVWLAFGFAGVAFLSRVTTAGVLPAWFLYAVFAGHSRRLRSWPLLFASLAYLAAGVAWILFVKQFSRYEMAADGKAEGFSWRNLAYFRDCLPLLLACGTCLPAAVGAFYGLRLRRRCPVGLYWFAWLASYSLFKLVMPTTSELRHFFTALPAFAGLAACLFDEAVSARCRKVLAPALVALALGLNVWQIGQLPRGVVGYEAVARQLALQEKGGNVMLACWEDQELIFRYRACNPSVQRRLIRSDRSLAIRLAPYAKVRPELRARTFEDVYATLRAGRIRYLLTCAPGGDRDTRTEEMVLAHKLVSSTPAKFRLLAREALLVQYTVPGWRGTVYLWEFLEEVPDGPSELPIVIPTAGLEFLSHN